MTNSDGRSTASGIRLLRSSVVPIILTALCATSCRTAATSTESHRELHQTSYTDSVSRESRTEETTVTLQPVPADTVGLTVSLPAIELLPEGSCYAQTRGHTRLTLMRRGNAIRATATTDSMSRERSVTRLRQEMKTNTSSARGDTLSTSSMTAAEKHTSPSRAAGWLAALIIASAIVIAGIKMKK